MRKLLISIIVVIFVASLIPLSFAHQSGCHRWHSCPSDSGSYTCGDTGYCSQCPNNQYCSNGQPRISSSGSSSSNEKSTPADTVKPLILTPSNMIVDATSLDGAIVEFSVNAIDDTDGLFDATCNPKSGSVFPIGNSNVACKAVDSAGNSATKSFTVTVRDYEVSIPSWIKDVAKFWCSNEIDDDQFIEAIQYLITNRVIVVPVSESGSGSSQGIPDWIKNNACWWSEGLISDDDFSTGIQFLIETGIIRI